MPSAKPASESSQLYHACGVADPEIQAAAYRELWSFFYMVAHQMTFDQPDGAALAQDCAQRALVRVHAQREKCREPKAFRSWCRRIVTNLVIDELRRRKRFLPGEAQDSVLEQSADGTELEREVLTVLTTDSLRELLARAPISERSRRVVVGRYLDELPDEQLASIENHLTETAVLPSHIQVTRSKNISKLKKWSALKTFLRPDENRGKE